MKRKVVKSSMIASLGYDAATSTLEIEFNSGKVWQYDDVPKSVYDEMKNADSLGRYFNDRIKDEYSESIVSG